jgi:hypothetical protein
MRSVRYTFVRSPLRRKGQNAAASCQGYLTALPIICTSSGFSQYKRAAKALGKAFAAQKDAQL